MQKVLFLDIETARVFEHFHEMPEDGQAAFLRKFGHRIKGYDGGRSSGNTAEFETADECYKEVAGLHAEYSKIICIVIGSFIKEDPKDPMSRDMGYLKPIKGSEDFIIRQLYDAIDKFEAGGNDIVICAHNGKKFDFPFIGRRSLIVGVPLHRIFDVFFLKPWEVRWIDTAEMWSFTDRSHYSSLIALAYVFGIPSPKTTIDGSMVDAAFRRGLLEDIITYCIGDTFTLMQVYRAMKGLPLLGDKRIAKS